MHDVKDLCGVVNCPHCEKTAQDARNAKVERMVEAACVTQDMFTENELEEYSDWLKSKKIAG